ncbi:MAG: NAD-dependent protein deacylase [Clostridia bacterium]|nr:NAD-dependent protein deacylase [Clostridia bacterium]
MLEKVFELKKEIEKANKICVFTGAGISCPSGIPDFRSESGLYNEKGDYKYSPEEMISHTFFVNNTKLFYEFYKSKMIYENARPNKAHLFFADLEKCGKDVRFVTQNIDSLHTMAGNKRVFEIHGSVKRNYCIRCSEFYDEKYILESKDIPYCKKCGGIVKPDVVLYEEGLDDKTVQGAVNAIQCADLLIVIGTSLAVYPAASFIKFFGGEKIVLINKSETSFDKKADIVIYDDIVNVIDKIGS